MVFKLAKKLKQTLADDARAAKPTKITMNHDTDEMLLFITKLKDTLTKEHGKNSAVKCPKYARGKYSNGILQCMQALREALSIFRHTAHQRDMFSLCRAMIRKKHKKT